LGWQEEKRRGGLEGGDGGGNTISGEEGIYNTWKLWWVLSINSDALSSFKASLS